MRIFPQETPAKIIRFGARFGRGTAMDPELPQNILINSLWTITGSISGVLFMRTSFAFFGEAILLDFNSLISASSR
jgi:hypothetical protein